MEAEPHNPFRGLRPYGEADQEKLFGRDRDLILIKDRILSARTTLLFAGSGVGKTSFLNAKVIPHFRKNYCVIWHNRWTGAAELDDRYPLLEEYERYWPPRDLVRTLAMKFRPSRVTVRPANESDRVPAGDAAPDALSAQVRQIVAQNLSRNGDRATTKLSEVMGVFRKSRQLDSAPDPGLDKKEFLKEGLPEKERCILVLDQFEEVFQYHSYQTYFNDFINDVCEIINNDDYQVRVVISMREEFLGELSIFDNRVPDLFTNYYRLKHPDKDEAEDIIERTAKLGGVATNNEKLSLLVEDLSKIETGIGAIVEPTEGKKLQGYVISRNFVAPPYLQIACERLWSEQYPAAKSEVNVTKQGTPAATASPAPFLALYNTGDENNRNGIGGDAQRVLRSFCEEKLSPPFLERREQDLAARAFSFLVTKQGAKMAYELSSLADHMDEQVAPLRGTLHKLSQPEARLLRESRGPDRSYWFELYHDMYAPIVDEWKRGYQKLKRKQDRRWWLVSIASPVALVLFVLALYYLVYSPLQYISKLSEYHRAQLQNGRGVTSAGGLADDLAVQGSYESLRDTPGYGAYARSLWADILEQRASQYELQEDRDSALLMLLQAAALRSSGPKQRADYQRAERLMGDDFRLLENTYGQNARSLSVSSDGKHVLTVGKDKTVSIYNMESSESIGSFCTDCEQALFSNDGKAIITLSKVIKEAEARRPDKTRNRPPELKKPGQSGESEDQAAPSSVPDEAKKPLERRSPNASATPVPTPGSETTKRTTRLEIRVWSLGANTSLVRSVLMSSPTGDSTPGDSTPVAAPINSAGDVTEEPKSERIDPGPPLPRFRAVGRSENSGDNADGSEYLIVGTLRNEIVVWRTDTGAMAGDPISSRESAKGSGPLSLTFTRDGNYMATYGNTTVPHIWKLTINGLILDRELTDFRPGRVFAFSSDGKAALGLDKNKTAPGLDKNKTVLLVDIPSGTSRPVTKATFPKLAFSQNGDKFVVNNKEGTTETAETFDTATLKPLYQPVKFNNITSRVELGADGKALLRVGVAPPFSFLDRWNLETGQLLGSMTLPFHLPNPVFSFDGTRILGLRAGVGRSWRLDSLGEVGIPIETTGSLKFLNMSKDGRILLIRKDEDGVSHDLVVEADTGKSVVELSPGDGRPGYTLSADGRVVAAVTGPRELTFWHADKGWAKSKINYDADIAAAIAISPDGKLLAVVAENEILVSSIETASVLAKLPAGAGAVLESLVFSFDNKYLVVTYDSFYSEQSGGFKRVRVFGIEQRKEVSLAGNISPDIRAPVVGPDAGMLTYGSDNIARLWDISTGTQKRDFSHDAKVVAAEFSHDGKWALTADETGVVRLWEVATGDKKDEFKVASSPNELRFGIDGKHLIVDNGAWLHRFVLENRQLKYLGGVTPGLFVSESLYVGSDQQRIRVIRMPARSRLESFSIDLSPAAPTQSFAGNPKKILEQWEKRLGLKINALGYAIRPDAPPAP